MKKIWLGTLAAVLAIGTGFAVPEANAETAQFLQIYKGEQVERFTSETGVWQSASVLNGGASSLYYCMEKQASGPNMFLRMTDFDGYGLTDHTAVNLRMDESAEEISVSMRYRLFEEEGAYRGGDPVIGLSAGGQSKTFTYAELKSNVSGDFAWNELSLGDFTADGTDSLRLTFYYTEDGAGVFDIDDLAVSAGGENIFAPGSFEFASADESSLPIYSKIDNVDIFDC